MTQSFQSRRRFLKASAGLAAAGVFVPYSFSAAQPATRSPNERFRIASIGMKYQGSVIADKAQAHGDIVAICDVDRDIAEKAKAQFGGKAALFEQYQDMLQRPDIDVVTIGSPDHWHTAMVIDAVRAGKDVYCEKPLTLTVDEGKALCRAVQKSGRVVQVGSWQRSDHNFRLACELVRGGRIGTLQKVTVILGKNKTGGPFARVPVPSNLNWNLWQGQTPDVPYIAERSHYTFRWWYEYSGGQMTDWGAHHIDIAQWGIGMDNSGPVEIDGRCRLPQVADGYNVAVDYQVKYRYANGVEMEVLDEGRNGVMFEGTAGRVFVNRGTVAGAPVDELKARPLDRGDFTLYGADNLDRPIRTGKLDAIINHMGNFFDCVASRKRPLSDVVSQHRSATTCHLGNISMRLGRPLKWDPEAERFVGDDEANTWLAREQRKGFEIEA
ncbi:Inositol 2-dehydrogenase [Caulifigura coniformis]|uniref:Inositol 2-dehydrogenase n=1 Tax=Caulifigura coniformis TaxID=2527983 RepID=A0A517SC90_9PLAN|nr:Gfo/Idh/MocA family oxidoreductase [Caulifigura coniformis]QDT53724.1 Inositol 2-dehydrogenase [Caulifigura coniformis]